MTKRRKFLSFHFRYSLASLLLLRTDLDRVRHWKYFGHLCRGNVEKHAGIIFTNILCAHFLYKTFGAKILNPKASFVVFGAKISYKNTSKKHWWNWQQVLISPTYFLWAFFVRKCFTRLFFNYRMALLFLGKMLVKLTTGWQVNAFQWLKPCCQTLFENEFITSHFHIFKSWFKFV